jgi:hypothetical protein
MLLFAILSLLVGMVFGQRFKIMILAPAISLTLLLAIGASIARAEVPWMVGLTTAVAIACLQIGYLLGIAIRHLIVAARASRRRAASFAVSLTARRSAH